MGTTTFVSCSEPVRSHDTKAHNKREGGALTASDSDVIFGSTSTFTYNHTENGGAIHAIDQSNLYVIGEATIAYNTADTGGGVYLDYREGKYTKYQL